MPEIVHDSSFEALLEHVKRMRGFDFTGYKRPSLMRRVKKRMADLYVKTYVDYVNYLDTHPGEFAELFNTILINVTSFFRDQEAWDYLAADIIPQILKNNCGDIRVWSAGCASGQEAYSIAMLLCEALGAEDFRTRVKIYATDVDEHALMQARHATYTSQDLENVTDAMKEKYFVVHNAHYTFRPDLRRSIIFGRHDLVQDAPISKLDLLICRNTLMYMNASTQVRILTRLNFALKQQGFLFLGKAEMLISQSDLFDPVNLKYRIFARTAKPVRAGKFIPAAEPTEAPSDSDRDVRLSRLNFDADPLPQLVIDLEGRLRLANESARRLFGISGEQVGAPLQDLDVSYKPVELRSPIQKSLTDLRAVRLSKVTFKRDHHPLHYLDVEILPISKNGGKAIGVAISFHDNTDFQHLSENLKDSHEELETTNEELQSTNEELETTNEELQSTNEELQTTNEELQSTHEELETMNEELQSTHEELAATSDELTALTDNHDNANLFLSSILSSLPGALIVLDRNWNVSSWNQDAENMWGLRSDEVSGQPFFELDIGLPTEELRQPLEQVVETNVHHKILDLETVDRRGKSLPLRITITPIAGVGGRRDSVVLIMHRRQLIKT